MECRCKEFQEKDYRERMAKIGKEIELEVEQMTPEQIKKELIELKKARVRIVSIGCICDDIIELDDC